MLLTDSISTIKNIGKTRATKLARLGILTISNLLFYFPRSHEDRTKTLTISEILESPKPHQPISITARLTKPVTNVNLRGGRTMQKATAADTHGNHLSLIWFNQNYLARTLKIGEEYTFFGKPELSGTTVTLTSPKYSPTSQLPAEGILPLYPLTAGITHKMLADAIREAMPAISQIQEFLPHELLEKYSLCDIHFAIKNIHFPLDFKSFAIARRRLVFQELFLLQLALRSLKSRTATQSATPLTETSTLSSLLKTLPFQLTDSQKLASREILDDLAKPHPMNRLLQGDVGSGKTIIAALAMSVAIASGKSAAIMAPTEILAQQHFQSFSKFFTNTCEVISLYGNQTAKERRETLAKLNDLTPKIIVGTHALIQKNVEIANLGLVVTDEQHRFGVRQRELFTQKGTDSTSPHLLVMTATPIPRTLALILYGDLDISIMNELPPGRKQVETFHVNESYRSRINTFICKQIAEGRQVYIVCPLVDESENIDAKAATAYVETLRQTLPPHLTIALMHGKLKPTEKSEVMKDFVDGNTNILVATSVIEVGVNVPNASVMVIENAERFGLAQLHQLRGRVGRGEWQSYCILFNQSDSQIAAERMETMKTTADGFILAEKDLELRGTGDFFGTRQHGLPSLQIANLYEDIAILEECKSAVDSILASGLENFPTLQSRIENMFIEGM